MLRRLNVRTRLVAVIALPVALLLAVAIPEALQRWDRAAGAERMVVASHAVSDVIAATEALQAERTLSAALRTGGGAEVQDLVRAQRQLTDEALTRATLALRNLAPLDPRVAATAERARVQLGDLPRVRAETDSAESIEPWVDLFAPSIAALLDVEEAAGTAATRLGLGGDLAVLALVARGTEAAAAQGAQLAAAATWGELRGDQRTVLAGLRADEVSYRTAYLAASAPETRGARTTEFTTSAVTEAEAHVDGVLSGEAIGTLASWLELSGGRLSALHDVQAARSAAAVARIEQTSDGWNRSSNVYLADVGLALVLALALALAAARSINRPLDELMAAVDQMAANGMSELVDVVRRPAERAPQPLTKTTPIEVRSHDELGRLAVSLNALQAAAVQVGAEQATLLEEGVSELYVNLARRNQALLERQIALLDVLESDEEDPEVLDHLYLLDHLATRMRRNAESLLILAGSEAGPRRAGPVPLVDVVRGALSEIEDYKRVELGTIEPATVHGLAVSDVAHLLAELLENATQFSPPSTSVRVDGERSGGSYRLTITDRGIGIRQEQMAELNDLLREPPVTGLGLGRALGCVVAARLAARHGIAVRLHPGATEGVVAYVVLPSRLLVADGIDLAVDGRGNQRARVQRQAQQPTPPSPPTAEEPVRPAVVPVTDVPARLRDALPERAAFEADLKALFDSEAGADPDAAPLAEGALTAVGAGGGSALRRRTPGATAEMPAPSVTAGPSRRSPDAVRGLLSQYRSGLQAGREAAGPTEEERT